MGIEIILHNVDPSLMIGQHLIFFQSLNGIDFVLLDILDCFIKGQGIYNIMTTWNLWILKGWKYLDEEKIREINLK